MKNTAAYVAIVAVVVVVVVVVVVADTDDTVENPFFGSELLTPRNRNRNWKQKRIRYGGVRIYLRPGAKAGASFVADNHGQTNQCR